MIGADHKDVAPDSSPDGFEMPKEGEDRKFSTNPRAQTKTGIEKM